jgi:protease secretion system outer membrane protein
MMSGSFMGGRAAVCAALVIGAGCTSGAIAQTSMPEPGIGAVPAPATPPAVETTPVPASPPLPQTTQGGRLASFPNADSPAPPNVPGVPAIPGADAAGSSGSETVTTGGAGAAPAGAARSTGPAAARGAARISPAAATGQLDLVTAYDLGQDNDATYRAALAERDANRQTANQTIAGYLPTAGYSYQNIPTEAGARHVATVTQPVVSLSGLATLRQRGPRRRYADATMLVRAQDLATRLMTAVSDIIKATEANTLNDARVDALKIQAERADRLYKRGLGTITDARDIEVRYEQGLANRALLLSDQIAAEARLRSITGIDVPDNAFALPAQLGPIELAQVDSYLARQSEENPAIEAARANERISKLESDRIRGSFLPVVGVSATFSRYRGVNDTFVGLSVTAPLNGGTFFQANAAKSTARRAYEERRQTEEKARVELARLYAMVSGGRQALTISAKAIEAAKLSVEANSKSYEGGVRTSVDVVNAIQTRFEVQSAYVQSAATLATNYLNLLLLAGEDPEEALAAVQKFLLGR